MSNKLGGKGTAYTGTNANQPPNWTFEKHNPNEFNTQNVSLGDMWLNTVSKEAFMLVSLARDITSPGPGSVAEWVKIESSAIPNLTTLTGNNAQDPITPDINGNINILGDNAGVIVTGNPLTNSLVVSLVGGGDAAETFRTDFNDASAKLGVINIIAGNSVKFAGSSVFFNASPEPNNDAVILNVTDGNLNTVIGGNAGSVEDTFTGGFNTALGASAVTDLTTGSFNTVVGALSGVDLTSGLSNTIIGEGSGHAITTGSRNVILGAATGNNYEIGDSDNICIGHLNAGIAGESNTLRISSGTGVAPGQINKAFIQGIHGITPTINDGIPVFISSDGQLGTVGDGSGVVTTLSGDGDVVVNPLLGNIKIIGDGATAAVTANPGTHELVISLVGGGGGGILNDLEGDEGGLVVPDAGIIHVVTDNVAVGAGSTVLFDGAIAHTLTLKVTSTIGNTMIGQGAGNTAMAGIDNTAVGIDAGTSLTTGSNNILFGADAGSSILGGNRNVLIGVSAGSSFISTESSNILINSTGTVGDSNVLVLGSGSGVGLGELNEAFIHGIVGITPTVDDGIPVFINSLGQLGTVGNGDTSLVSTLTGNNPLAISPVNGNINIQGDGSTIVVTGAGDTLTIVGLGGGGGTLAQISGDVAFATPNAGIINIITNNISQGAGSSVLFRGDESNTLTLEVTDALDNTIIGADGGTTGITGFNNTALGNACATDLTSGSSNIFLGNEVGNLITTGSGNFLCGDSSLNAVLQGSPTSTGLYAFGASNGLLFLHNWGGSISGNTFVGYGSGSSFNAGQQSPNTSNTACGKNTLAGITTGINNSVFGAFAGSGITSGSYNALIGITSGVNYSSNESSNICINAPGVINENNTLRLGVSGGAGNGQLNRAFIHGIRGITTGVANAIPVVIDSAGQLGTAGGGSVITELLGNTGFAVHALGGQVKIFGDGTSINVVGDGNNTLTVSAVGGAGGPSFVSYRSTDFPLISATLTTVTYDTVSSNVGGAFNGGTGTFTAPVTGLYNFSFGALVSVGNGSAFSNPIVVQLVTTNRSFQLFPPTLGITSPGGINQFYVGNNFYTNMTAGDTAKVTIFAIAPGVITPAIKGITTINPPNNPGINTFFSGELA